MAGRTSAATERALRMVARGEIPLRAAQKQGIAPSTIYQAMKRLGIASVRRDRESQAA